MDAERARRQGLAGVFYALGAFGSWGIVVPLHFKLLGSVPAPLILAQRILWASLMTLGLIAFLRRLGELRKALSPNRSFVLLCLSAFLIGANWLVFIWAVNTGHLVQTSLGYFINPLVSVALGVLFLGERLRPLQIAACALAAGGVLLLTVAAGTLPWISLTLAFSFGVYGLIRKTVPVDPLIGFCVESLVLLPPAAAYLVVQGFSGGGSIFGDSAWVALLLVLTGVTTAAPLIWFAAAAQRLKTLDRRAAPIPCTVLHAPPRHARIRRAVHAHRRRRLCGDLDGARPLLRRRARACVAQPGCGSELSVVQVSRHLALKAYSHLRSTPRHCMFVSITHPYLRNCKSTRKHNPLKP
jgi:chloramphenicol-sensitive protein RarD